MPNGSGHGSTEVQVTIPSSSGLLLSPLTGDLPAYHQQIAASLSDAAGRVYIDTSFLLWLIRVGRTARREFLEFWNREEVRATLYVPVWAVHEFYQHLQQGTVSRQLNHSVKEYTASLTSLAEHADVVSDDSLCESTSFHNRQELIDSIRVSALRLTDCVALLKTQVTLYDEAVSELITFVNEHSLGTDVYKLLQEDHEAFKGRLQGRLPPGYEDGGKPDNVFGDLVFWMEILKHGKDTEHVLILTRDDKVDWRHIPNKMLVYDQSSTSTHNMAGGRLQEPHPLLRFEASLSGIQHLNVITPPILTLVCLVHFTNVMPMLLKASNPRPLSLRTSSPNVQAMAITIPLAPQAVPTPPPTPETSGTPLFVLSVADMDLEVLKTGAPRTALQQIRVLLAEGQVVESAPSLLTTTQELLSTLDSYALVELGHLVTSAPGPLGLLPIPDLLSAARSISVQSEAALALGCLLAVYFTDDLILREEPLQSNVAALLNLMSQGGYEGPRLTATRFLEEVSAKILVTPAAWTTEIEVDINLIRAPLGPTKLVQATTIHGKSLLDDSATESKRFTNCIAPTSAPLQAFLNALASTFAIPSGLLKTGQTNRTQMLSWSVEEGFSSLRLRGAGLTNNMELGFASSQTEEL